MFRFYSRSLANRSTAQCRLVLESLEVRNLLSTLYALTDGNSLLRFDSATPNTIQASVGITGLLPLENLLGIDFRPATGQLYGLGSTSRLYTINLQTGAATVVNETPFTTLLSGTSFGFDFNPTVDRIRITSDANQNLRVNPNTGAVLVDADLNPGDPNVVGSAYSNNFFGAATTTLYAIDSAADTLSIQTPPNDGTLVSVGPLNVDISDQVGFDIVGGAGGGTAGTAMAALTVGSTPGLYSIDLAGGGATLVGTIGDGTQAITGLASVPDGFRFYAIGGGAGKAQVVRTDGTLVVEFNAYINTNVDVNVAVGDMNRDGIADLVTATATTLPHVRVFDGADFADGTFDPNNTDASVITEFFAYGLIFGIGATVAVGDVSGDLINDLVTGGASGNPEIKVFDGAAIANGTFNPANPNASSLFRFLAYGANFNVGASVAVGDLDRDGFRELITGALPGNPHVKVFDGAAFASGGTFDPNNPDASLLTDFFAYGIGFNVGVNVSVGDTNGDGFVDLLTGASRGNPQVRVFNGDAFRTGTFDPDTDELTNFFAFEQNADIGVRVGSVDFNLDGVGEILTGSANRQPTYRIFSGAASGNDPVPLLDVLLAGFTGNVSVGG